jgi:hypothetical protein
MNERPPAPADLDVLMPAVTAGRILSRDQLERLFDSADLQLHSVIQTTGPMRIIETFAAWSSTRLRPEVEAEPARGGR